MEKERCFTGHFDSILILCTENQKRTKQAR